MLGEDLLKILATLAPDAPDWEDAKSLLHRLSKLLADRNEELSASHQRLCEMLVRFQADFAADLSYFEFADFGFWRKVMPCRPTDLGM